jgi:sialic acid synthase SpsE
MIQSITVGADFFKVQVYDTKYMGNNWKHKKAFYGNCELGNETIINLKNTAEIYGAELMATVNQPHLVKRLHDIGIRNIKIASGQILNPLVEEINKFTWDRVFISTGMLEVEHRLSLIDHFRCTKEVVVMHCVSLYPTCDPETNLSRIYSLMEHFKNNKKIKIGYSDHHLDELPVLGAMFMGASYIEKHIRLPGSFGPTSEIAADMTELSRMCNLRLRVEAILGEGELTMLLRKYLYLGFTWGYEMLIIFGIVVGVVLGLIFA